MLCITRNLERFAKFRAGATGGFAWWQAVQLRVAMYTQIQLKTYIRVWSQMAHSDVFESKQEGNEWLA